MVSRSGPGWRHPQLLAQAAQHSSTKRGLCGESAAGFGMSLITKSLAESAWGGHVFLSRSQGLSMCPQLTDFQNHNLENSKSFL